MPLYLGEPSFKAGVTLLAKEDPVPRSSFPGGEVDFGWLLHDVVRTSGYEPRFSRAVACDGVIDVPPDGDAALVR